MFFQIRALGDQLRSPIPATPFGPIAPTSRGSPTELAPQAYLSATPVSSSVRSLGANSRNRSGIRPKSNGAEIGHIWLELANLTKSAPIWPGRADQILPNSARRRPICCRLRSMFGRTRRHLAQAAKPELAEFGRTCPKLWPDFDRLGPLSARFCQLWPGIGETWAEFDRTWAEIDRRWREWGQGQE